ncbi:MAG: murein biosynthesis integral membrane protein MurJ, partial [Eggerthellaceae bacterium]|nr:murein biosynthesis integral membrane protein MurJ [Eggerthellaceae bacterium]
MANAEDTLPGVPLADTDTPAASVADVDGSSGDAGSTANVAKNTALMSVATLGSRITGLLRTWVMAFALGNTLITSAYQVANNMPNVIYDLVAGGMLGAAFIPVYLLQKEREKQAGANHFANNMLNITAVVLGALSLVAAIFAPAVIATQTFTVDSSAE